MKPASTTVIMLLTGLTLLFNPSTGHATPVDTPTTFKKLKAGLTSRSVVKMPSCPYYCYDHQYNTNKLQSWCRSQAFCRNPNSTSRSSYSRYRYCPSNCFHPYRDYYKMKNWCYNNGVCSRTGNPTSTSPHQVLKRNYSLRNYRYQKVGKTLRFTLNNMGTTYQWTVSSLPSGAAFDPTTLSFMWKPKSWHVGSHFITFTVGEGKNKASKTIEIRIKEQWEAFFLPGISYTSYIPNDTKMLGTYHGISLSYILLAWVHRNEKRGPSHGRVYFKLDIMSSTEELLDQSNNDAKDMIYWAFGIDLSFERNPKRPFAIPFFGLELGGSYSSRRWDENGDGILSNDDNKLGGVFHITPTFGMHIWSDRNFFVTVTGGYSFAVQDQENLRGWRIGAGVNFTFW